MTFPNITEKYDSEPIITPAKRTEYRERMGADEVAVVPDAAILCYSESLLEYLTDEYDGRFVEGGYLGDFYAFADTDFTVGVLGNFGIGAPVTAMLMEELIGDGVDRFLSVGLAGCLDPSVHVGEFIVCEKAIRDEGTSHHYVPADTFAYPSEGVVERIEDSLKARDIPFHTGPSWTTDAIYQETELEVDRYATDGILTVEMEAAAVFTVAEVRGVTAGAMFVMSDYLGTAEWEPKFHLTREDMQRLGDTAKQVLHPDSA